MHISADNISGKIEAGIPVEIIFHQDENESRLILLSIKEMCSRYAKAEWTDALYGCVKELLMNASRANLKRAFFYNAGLDINNMADYVGGLVRFRRMMDEHKSADYAQALEKLKLSVIFRLEHSPDGILLEVINNSAISSLEEARVRMKLSKAMNYDDIALFYTREMDDAEGPGLGIALLVILMKSVGLDPGLFRIGSKGDVTTARIEVPLTDKYVLKRGKQ